MKYGEIGILQIGNERYGFRPLELTREFCSTPIMKGELLENMFTASNRKAKADALRDTNSGPQIKNIIFNDPATIVIWEDGTKTVVKCQEGDTYSKETGLALCIAKKYLGNKGNFNEVFMKWIPEETETIEVTPKNRGIEVGDLVRVVDWGKIFPDYDEWVDKYIYDDALLAKWRGGSVEAGTIGCVKCIAPHEYKYYENLAYIDVGDRCILIEILGLEKVEGV